ncbi:MAG: hypothetical protein DF168_01634 [Candidatus Moanabacter tarae]|uniref:Uncharacterized protein n=1 Tax=Candidatus Moanibacter tarae TaxID=2200854 RepID=A0A2Z4AFS9_9BACT|nr:MAG: hypothetical protein DF168_01634 [Candidatus Moanabacter tarae]
MQLFSLVATVDRIRIDFEVREIQPLDVWSLFFSGQITYSLQF